MTPPSLCCSFVPIARASPLLVPTVTDQQLEPLVADGLKDVLLEAKAALGVSLVDRVLKVIDDMNRSSLLPFKIRM